ncbi:MAG TPA: hypothetical protein VJ816_09360 [Gemmatimonadales bacterium]|nr:hypothetical protein [Gemmatimonadales bacterium]
MAKLLRVQDARVRQWRLWGSPWGPLLALQVGSGDHPRHVFNRADVDDFIRRRATHYDKLARQGRTLPPGVRWPGKPKPRR